jgi:hypothetical protein
MRTRILQASGAFLAMGASVVLGLACGSSSTSSGDGELSPYSGTFTIVEVGARPVGPGGGAVLPPGMSTCMESIPMPTLPSSMTIAIRGSTFDVRMGPATPTPLTSGEWDEVATRLRLSFSPSGCVPACASTPPMQRCSDGGRCCPTYRVDITWSSLDALTGTFTIDYMLDAACGPSMCLMSWSFTGTRAG